MTYLEQLDIVRAKAIEHLQVNVPSEGSTLFDWGKLDLPIDELDDSADDYMTLPVEFVISNKGFVDLYRLYKLQWIGEELKVDGYYEEGGEHFTFKLEEISADALCELCDML